MTEKERQYYIDWLLIAYPFKAVEYFERMTDRELLVEFEKTMELM